MEVSVDWIGLRLDTLSCDLVDDLSSVGPGGTTSVEVVTLSNERLGSCDR